MLIGTNIRRDGSDTVASIVQSGAMVARFVPMVEHDLTAYLTALDVSDVATLAVLAKESFGFGPRIDWPLASVALSTYKHRYGGLVSYWQIGNEYDAESPSSWTLALSDLDRLGKLAREILGDDAYLIVGGAADGSPADEADERLSGYDLDWADGIAIHTYGQGVPGWVNDAGIPVLPLSPYGFPSTLRDLIDGYRAEAPDHEVWITEMGFRWDELQEQGAAAYCDAYLNYLLHKCPEVVGFTQFCLTDDQVHGFGLTDGKGKPHLTAPIFKRYADAARAAQEQPPTPPPPPVVLPMTAAEAEDAAWADLFLAATGERSKGIVYAPSLGIVKYWREHHAELGSAVGPERPASDGSGVWQAFSQGVVKWDPAAGASKVA